MEAIVTRRRRCTARQGALAGLLMGDISRSNSIRLNAVKFIWSKYLAEFLILFERFQARTIFRLAGRATENGFILPRNTVPNRFRYGKCRLREGVRSGLQKMVAFRRSNRQMVISSTTANMSEVACGKCRCRA